MQGKESARPLVRKKDPRKQGGFTIVEIMVVVVIIGMLATVVVANLIGDVDTAKLAKVKRDLNGLSEAAERYYYRLQSWPESFEDLVNPETGSSFIKEVPKDPWNQDYQIDGMDEKGEGLFIRCAGDDKEFETEDDITTENFRNLRELPKIDRG